MINGVNVWHVIMLACGLFNFFYILYAFLKEDGFDGFDNCLFSVIMMLFGAATSVLGTICIIGFWIYCYIKDTPRRNAERREKLCGLIQEFNIMTGKDKYER